MTVLEFRLKDIGYACVTRQEKTEKQPVTYKVEIWDKSKWYHSKTFYSFEKAELYYWNQLTKEFL
jgi:hypothetical protein